MALTNAYAAKLHASAESAFGSIPLFAADDAVAHIQADFGPSQTQRKRHRKDRTCTRSPSLELVHGAKDPVSASFSRSIAPGTTTTMDTHEILTNAFGSLATSTYSIAANPTDSLSFQLSDVDQTYADYLSGCVVESWGVEWGEEEPIETFSLMAARRGSLAKTTLNTTIDNSETTIILDDPEKVLNAYGITILIGTEAIQLSNTASDWTYAASTVTIANVTRGVSGTSGAAHTAADAVSPYGLACTTAKSPIGEHQVSLTYNGVTFVDTEGSLSFTTGRGLRPMERGNSFVAGLVNRRLEVTGSFRGIMDTGTDADLPGYAVLNKEAALVLTIGTVATSIMTITLPAVELRMSQPWPDDDPLTWDAEIIGLGSSGNDDIGVVIT